MQIKTQNIDDIDDKIADMLSNKKLQQIVTELLEEENLTFLLFLLRSVWFFLYFPSFLEQKR